MKLIPVDNKSLKIGDKVMIAVDENHIVSDVNIGKLVEATVIMRAGDFFLVGWKNIKETPDDPSGSIFIAQDHKARIPAIRKYNDDVEEIKDIDSYCSSAYLNDFQYYKIAMFMGATTIKKSAGCLCGWCGNFSQYAEPNQADESFKCYSCRSSGKIRKLY